MLNIEIAEVMQTPGKMFSIAQKVHYKKKLDNEEKDVAEIADAWVKEAAEKGDPDKEIAAFVKRTTNDEIYETPDDLLDMMFDRGTIGEFDDTETTKDPKNTLVAYEAAKGGTVDASYLDFTALKPTWKNRQVEFKIPYVQMRQNGFRTVATYTTYATEALQNTLFHDMFSAIDQAIGGGEQMIVESESKPTQSSMDQLALYLTDRNSTDSVAVALTKYCQAIGRMDGYAQYMSEDMKNDFNRYGLAKFFSGIAVAGISGAKKISKGNLLIPDKRIFGVAGKIGTLDMKGEMHVYEDMDNGNEVCHVRVKDFTYGYTITHIENTAKIVLG